MATSIVNVPAARVGHSATWTGTEMIVWGGDNTNMNSGGRYNPSTDSWTSTSYTDAPEARVHHTAVWTGTEMIVWGGWGEGGAFSNGARYYPSTNSWTPISNINVPNGRYLHTAVWTGTEMIIWGGYADIEGIASSGGRYDLFSDSWVATSSVYVPSARYNHTAVWTGVEMIIWGGQAWSGWTIHGAKYNRAIDNWSPISTINVPDGRDQHTAIWTGNEMVIWGGEYDQTILPSGGRYDPLSDSWTVTSSVNAPEKRFKHTAIWTGTEMIIWGGANDYWATWALASGGCYDPSTDSWSSTSNTDVPDGRFGHTALWSGTEMIVWGGINYDQFMNTGGRYNPSTDSWVPTSNVNIPEARSGHTAVWTGSEMLIWGGYTYLNEYENRLLSNGARYNPLTDSWSGISSEPKPCFLHTALWTGSEMIIWGGTCPENNEYLFSGAHYNPITNSWRPASNINAPDERFGYTAVWTGTEMIIWGGMVRFGLSQTGALYCVGPNLKISDVSIEEGKKGGKTLKFVVTLSTPLDFTVKVDYATADGTATEAGNDYIAKSGTKRIRRGETSTTIKIKVKGDKIAEAHETFTVNLTNAIGVGIADPQGVGTITNDD